MGARDLHDGWLVRLHTIFLSRATVKLCRFRDLIDDPNEKWKARGYPYHLTVHPKMKQPRGPWAYYGVAADLDYQTMQRTGKKVSVEILIFDMQVMCHFSALGSKHAQIIFSLYAQNSTNTEEVYPVTTKP